MISDELNTESLIGLEAAACFELLDKRGLKYTAEALTDKKAESFDKELVIAVREREYYLHIVVGRFDFSVRK